MAFDCLNFALLYREKLLPKSDGKSGFHFRKETGNQYFTKLQKNTDKSVKLVENWEITEQT